MPPWHSGNIAYIAYMLSTWHRVPQSLARQLSCTCSTMQHWRFQTPAIILREAVMRNTSHFAEQGTQQMMHWTTPTVLYLSFTSDTCITVQQSIKITHADGPNTHQHNWYKSATHKAWQHLPTWQAVTNNCQTALVQTLAVLHCHVIICVSPHARNKAIHHM
jgi:hypothetical protein